MTGAAHQPNQSALACERSFEEATAVGRTASASAVQDTQLLARSTRITTRFNSAYTTASGLTVSVTTTSASEHVSQPSGLLLIHCALRAVDSLCVLGQVWGPMGFEFDTAPAEMMSVMR